MSNRPAVPSLSVALVAGTELWERFSYYGISALFVLFLTAPVADGGFGWPPADALRLYGLYAGLAFASPVVGGWLSSSRLGERRCIVLGGGAIMIGHVLLGGPAMLPWLTEKLTGVPVTQILADIETHGRLTLDESLRSVFAQALQGQGAPGSAAAALAFAYLAKGWSFVLGLGFVIAGTALIKPTISSIVGKLYSPEDPRRVFAFTLFTCGIWAGALLANLVAGTLGERAGWHYGFMAAAVGMGIGLTTYLLLQNRLLGDIGRQPDAVANGPALLAQLSALSPGEKRKLAAIGVMSLFTVLYSAAFYQMMGLLHLFVSHSVERRLGGFEIPASWFLSVSTVSFLVFAPLIARWLTRRGREHRPVGPESALTIGLLLLAGGYALLLLTIGGVSGAGGSSHAAAGIVAAYMLFGLADVFVWPSQLALVTALAPRSMTSFAVGSWYVAVGLGTYLAGILGALGQTTGTLTIVAGLFVMLLMAAGALQRLRPWLVPRLQS